MRTISILSAILSFASLLLAAPARAADAPGAGALEFPCNGVIIADNVFMRAGEAVSFRDLGTLPKNTVVKVVAASPDGRWVRILPPDSGDVYVFAKFVTVEGEIGTTTVNRVNVRVRPLVTSEEVAQIPKGTILRIKGREGDWLKVAPPEGTQAWVSAEHVRCMSDAQLEAWREQLARDQAEKERQAAELARKLELARAEEVRKLELARAEEVRKLEFARAEQARKAKEARLLAEADKSFAAELAKPAPERALASAAESYRSAAAEIREPALLAKVKTRTTLIQLMQNIQAAAEKTVQPDPLPGIDLNGITAELGVPNLAAEIRTAYARARNAADEAERAKLAAEKTRLGEEDRRKSERSFDGWIAVLGPGLEQTGAALKLTSGGRVVALLKKNDKLDLAPFIGIRVRVTGQLAGEAALGAEKVPLLDVIRSEIVSN